MPSRVKDSKKKSSSNHNKFELFLVCIRSYSTVSIKKVKKKRLIPYHGTDNNDYLGGTGFCCSQDESQLRDGVQISNRVAETEDPELYQYYDHADHLGSSSYITNLDGEVVQHVEYVPFGEVFIEERNNTWNTPYLFNGKELDEETGLYYYGARYYNPRVSQWLSVDPIALYDPINEVEHYLDGQHNGGYFNPRNTSVYGYTYQNPIVYVDPNGKQTYFMHGTFVNDIGMSSSSKNKIQKLFGNSTSFDYQHKPTYNESTGETMGQTLPNSIEGRRVFAKGLVEYIKSTRKEGEVITIVGHSHGGNVGIMAANMLEAYYGDEVEINLLTINTPSRDMYRLDGDTGTNHINVYNDSDIVQRAGGSDTEGKGIIGKRAGRTQPNATNLKYNDQFKLFDESGCGASGHCGQADRNVKQWFPKVEKSLEE